jgi:hypothetical protein
LGFSSLSGGYCFFAGIEVLAGYLLRNVRRGIQYNQGNTFKGDYDTCKTVEEVLDMLRGK